MFTKRSIILPKLAGDNRLLACMASSITRLATDLLLLYHSTSSVSETLCASVMLPLAITVSSHLLYYANVI